MERCDYLGMRDRIFSRPLPLPALVSVVEVKGTQDLQSYHDCVARFELGIELDKRIRAECPAVDAFENLSGDP